jgi:hypothetical protein
MSGFPRIGCVVLSGAGLRALRTIGCPEAGAPLLQPQERAVLIAVSVPGALGLRALPKSPAHESHLTAKGHFFALSSVGAEAAFSDAETVSCRRLRLPWLGGFES